MPLLKHEEDGWAAPEGGQQPDWESANNLSLSVDSEPDELDLGGIDNIAITFPAFNDGRGLSLAVLLRTRYNFSGPLHAVGAIHEDIAHYLLRCGFDHLWFDESKDAAELLELLAPYSDHYQSSVVSPTPRFRRAAV